MKCLAGDGCNFVPVQVSSVMNAIHTARISIVCDAPSSDHAFAVRCKCRVIYTDRSCLIIELDTSFEAKQRDVVRICFPCVVFVYHNLAYPVSSLRLLTIL